MKLLIDTHLLLWIAADRLPKSAEPYIRDMSNLLFFSPASLWEIVIKSGLGRPDFKVSPQLLHDGLMENGYKPLNITSKHVLAVGALPAYHKDPFDRILLAQSISENVPLLTADTIIKKYPAPVIYIEGTSNTDVAPKLT